jgi:hypothetical protein
LSPVSPILPLAAPFVRGGEPAISVRVALSQVSGLAEAYEAGGDGRGHGGEWVLIWRRNRGYVVAYSSEHGVAQVIQQLSHSVSALIRMRYS